MPLPESVRDLLHIAAALADTPYAAAGLAASGEVEGVGFGFELPTNSEGSRHFVRRIVEEGTVVVPDAQLDPRFADAVTVAGPPYLRFILGVPLLGAAGERIGYLSVADRRHREPAEIDITVLELIARSVVTHLDLARALEERAAGQLDLQRSAAIVRSSDDAILSVDRDGVVLSWNPAAARMFGYDASEVLGRDFSFIPAPEAIDEAWSTFTRVLDDPRVFRIELPLQTRGGVRFEASITGSPIRDEAGRAMALAAIVRDISEVRRMERETLELQERLAQGQRLEALGRLAGGVAHDFNNLLAVILNFAAFVEEDLPEDSATRADVAEIRRAAVRAAEITRQLLLFSRQEPAVIEPVDLDRLLRDFAPLLRRSVGEAIDLRLEPALAGTRVAINRTHLEQVLLNLVLNSRDAMPEGGTLTISTSTSTRRPGLACMSVADTGTGMTDEIRGRAFEPFFTTKPTGAGTGLGLSTSYGIVERLGGSLTLESRLEGGTLARVELPVAAGTPGADGPGDPGDEAGRPGTALVVEDSEAVRQLVVRILEMAGWHVLAVASAVEALEVVRRSGDRLDVVVSDVSLDGMNGIELVKLVAERRPELPVVLMSGFTQDDLGESLPAPLLAKPFSADDLLRMLREARSGSRTRGSSR